MSATGSLGPISKRIMPIDVLLGFAMIFILVMIAMNAITIWAGGATIELF